MSEELKITPRNLGAINLDTYCPACLKYLIHIGFHPPYGIHAGIFGDAQHCQEAILGYYLDNQGCLPEEFAPFCDCVARTKCDKHWTKFGCTHKSGVLLYGSPDEVMTLKDGSQCILDHKTARPKDGDDPFHGQYVTQVVGYAYIAEGLGLGKVTKGGNIYWSAQVETVEANPSGHYKHATLLMPLKPSTVEIEIDYEMLDPLIEEFKNVWNAKEVPAGRERCKDCKKRDLLFAVEEEFKGHDEAALRDWTLLGWESRRREVKDRISRRDDYRRKLLAEFGIVGSAIFSPDGMTANWEFLPSSDSADAVIK